MTTSPSPGGAVVLDFVPRAQLAAMHEPAAATQDELAAVRRLIAIAKTDSGQGNHAANFLLAWWNASECRGFDLTEIWAVDASIVSDMLIVFGMIGRVQEYPTDLDPTLDPDFRAIVRRWWPELAD